MNRYTIIALVTLFVTTFTLFLGWVPSLGVILPQVAFVILLLAMRPDAFVSKTMILYYLFFLYETAIRAVYGVGYDIVTGSARFLVMAVPLLVSTVLFSPKGIKDCKGVAKYALIVSFITVLMSIRVLIGDGNALRLCSMANSTGDEAMMYGYWRQGMADYGMAAMMAFMPVVLLYINKSLSTSKVRTYSIIGTIIIIAFMYLGQVTTTFILCIMATILAYFSNNNKVFTYVGIGMVALLIITQFSEIMEFAISNTGEGSMNGNFVSIAEAANGEAWEETSDAAIRWGLLQQTIDVFLSHPLFGNPSLKNGGHNYFLNWLATVGLVGCLPFFMFIRYQYKVICSYLSKEAQKSYKIILMLFILHGLIKNMSGTEYWNYLFVYYPAILVWIDSLRKDRIMKTT